MNPRRQLAKIIREELTHSDSVLVPESTLQSFRKASSADLSSEATLLAYENGWTANLKMPFLNPKGTLKVHLTLL